MYLTFIPRSSGLMPGSDIIPVKDLGVSIGTLDDPVKDLVSAELNVSSQLEIPVNGTIVLGATDVTDDGKHTFELMANQGQLREGIQALEISSQLLDLDISSVQSEVKEDKSEMNYLRQLSLTNKSNIFSLFGSAPSIDIQMGGLWSTKVVSVKVQVSNGLVSLGFPRTVYPRTGGFEIRFLNFPAELLPVDPSLPPGAGFQYLFYVVPFFPEGSKDNRLDLSRIAGEDVNRIGYNRPFVFGEEVGFEPFTLSYLIPLGQ